MTVILDAVEHHQYPAVVRIKRGALLNAVADSVIPSCQRKLAAWIDAGQTAEIESRWTHRRERDRDAGPIIAEGLEELGATVPRMAV